jgi:phosphate-selective porin OprO and OprP
MSHSSGLHQCSTSLIRSLFVFVLVTFAAVQSVHGQGAFYVEVVHEERIHVFNNMRFYEIWSKSGEMPHAISRPGYGPNAETVVFDSDEAIHLYNFKHGLPGEPIVRPATKQPVMTFGWRDGKTTFATDNAQLVLSNRVQIRYTQEDPEVGDSRGSFRARRVRTKLDGWIYNRNLAYELQMDWSDTSNALQDANIVYTVSPAFNIKAGQFKVPFSRQQLTSSGSQQFVDRSIVSGNFDLGRDLGVQIGGFALDRRFEWRTGVFNGAGRTRTVNNNDKFQYNARLQYQPFGDVRYSEGDFESTDRPLLAFGVGLQDNDLHGATTGNDLHHTTVSGDGAFKYRGLFAFAEYFGRDNEPQTGSSFDSSGLHAQLGYFIIPQKLEVAGRWARLNPNDNLSGNDRTETGIAGSWYYNKHNLKLQGDLRQVENKATARTDREARLQFQFIF